MPRVHNLRVREWNEFPCHPVPSASLLLSPTPAIFKLFFSVYPMEISMHMLHTYAHILKTMDRLWWARLCMHVSFCPYHSISSCLVVFSEGVWMHPNLFTRSVNNGNLCHSQYFVIKKNHTRFSEYPGIVLFHTCRHSIAAIPRNGIAGSNIINF